MNKKIISIIGIVLVVVIGGWFLTRSDDVAAPDAGTSDGTSLAVPAPGFEDIDEAIVADGADEPDATVREFAVDSFKFGFNTSEIRVNEGDTVRITLTNSDGFHDWVVDEFAGARTRQINQGDTDTIEFVADKAGTYAFYCSVGNHRELGMEGAFIVE